MRHNYAMWQCPNCDRSFTSINQHHFCSALADTIDGYIEQAPAERREALQRVREVIAAVIPEAEERMAWKMPTFWQGKNLIQFSAAKEHLGLYPGAEAVAAFADRLDALGYSHAKGTIRIPWSQDMPYGLIGEIAAHRLAMVS